MSEQRNHKGRFLTGHDPLFPKRVEYTEKLQKMLKKKDKK